MKERHEILDRVIGFFTPQPTINFFNRSSSIEFINKIEKIINESEMQLKAEALQKCMLILTANNQNDPECVLQNSHLPKEIALIIASRLYLEITEKSNCHVQIDTKPEENNCWIQ